MLKITKNGKTLDVTKGAFENTFKDQGWVIANGISDNGVEAEMSSTFQDNEPEAETEDDIPVDDVDESEDETSDEEWDDVEDVEDVEDDEVEKPISEMSKSELVQKAESLGIDLGGQRYTSNQIRDMIREATK